MYLGKNPSKMDLYKCSAWNTITEDMLFLLCVESSWRQHIPDRWTLTQTSLLERWECKCVDEHKFLGNLHIWDKTYLSLESVCDAQEIFCCILLWTNN